ncbi:hypothetical protein HDE69_001984 [Pedobacter cryoconitis]|uniref:Immunity protein 22 of polymorphic toxin system n=1 Tax=Pedobacter cryoconitis TaxID=188932 RepID=A0A7W9DJ90_9SPHI|nr:immunity 22 family protein [Pedobacter cryoconitis]MBB5620931.1 hypothetical protein [Pedobacter cryoconitis]
MAQQKIHVWAGTTDKTEEQFDKYFDQSKFIKDNSDPNQRSQFGKDLNLEKAYDENWITVYHSRKRISIQSAIEELPIWDDQLEVAIYQAGVKKGVPLVNAIISYADDQLTIEKPLNSYNNLVYLGSFTNPS